MLKHNEEEQVLAFCNLRTWLLCLIYFPAVFFFKGIFSKAMFIKKIERKPLVVLVQK
jgi:hypothetical protein